MSAKPETSESVDLLVNIGIHVVLLATILLSVFVFVISPLTQGAFESQMQQLSNSAASSALTQLNTADNGATKANIVSNSNILNAAVKLFSSSDPTRVANNHWLLSMTALCIIFLIITIIIFVITISLVANQSVPVWAIIKQNLVAFFFIGMIEVWFFLSIASKFVPVAPSYLTTQIVCRARQNLLGSQLANC